MTSSTTADVDIVIGQIPKTGIEFPTLTKPLTQASEHQFWFDVPTVGRCLVEKGSRIVVEPAPNVDEANITSLITGTAFQALLMQRRMLVWNGVVVAHNGMHALILGNVATGKSTLAFSLQQAGLSVVCDGLAILDDAGMVAQGWNWISLWQDSCRKFDIDYSAAMQVRANINKYYQSLPERQPASLSSIYVLSTHNQPDVVVKQIKGIEKFQFLLQRTEKMEYRQLFSDKPWIMKSLTRTAQRARVVKLIRPQTFDHLGALTNAVVDDLAEHHGKN